MQITCSHCGKQAEKPTGEVNRARKAGLSLYCDRVCSGLGRRGPVKTIEQKKAEKRQYDKAFRAANFDRIKAEKAAHFKRTYDPAKAAVERKARMPRHVEYCRRAEYRAWKREYDRRLSRPGRLRRVLGMLPSDDGYPRGSLAAGQ